MLSRSARGTGARQEEEGKARTLRVHRLTLANPLSPYQVKKLVLNTNAFLNLRSPSPRSPVLSASSLRRLIMTPTKLTSSSLSHVRPWSRRRSLLAAAAPGIDVS